MAVTQPSDRARNAAAKLLLLVDESCGESEAILMRAGEMDADPIVKAFATFERETPGFAAGVEAEEIERDIRTALWNTGRWQGNRQAVVQSFIRHAMEEPCMIRALTAIRNLTPAPPASEGLDTDALVERLQAWRETPFEGDPMIDALLVDVPEAADALLALKAENDGLRNQLALCAWQLEEIDSPHMRPHVPGALAIQCGIKAKNARAILRGSGEAE